MTDAEVQKRFEVTWTGTLAPRVDVPRPEIPDNRAIWATRREGETFYGFIAEQVWCRLSERPMTTAQLCRVTGCSPRQVASALQRFRRQGVLRIVRVERVTAGRPRHVYRVAA